MVPEKNIKLMDYPSLPPLQESNGGVFSVDSSSSATFTQAMVFEDNSVVSPYHGGAVYAGGMVRRWWR